MLATTLRQLAGRCLTDEDGHEVTLELLPPATEEELRQLEAVLPAPLPEDIRAALQVAKGLANGPLESFSLVDLAGFGLEELFPHAYSVAHDGFGNYWVLDLLPAATTWGPVFYACHDPPVVAYQAATVDEFLEAIVALWERGPRSPVDLVHEDIVRRIWREDPDLMTPAEATATGDIELATFAASLPSSARIADLRNPRLGKGFAWGRHGPRTTLRRAGAERIWAILPPERGAGFLARLFGGSAGAA